VALIVLALLGMVAAVYWEFEGRWRYSSWKGHRNALANMETRAECTSRWENVRRFTPVLRPGYEAHDDDQWYTPIAYDLVSSQGHRDSYFGLFRGKSPKLDTCREKVSAYPSPVMMEPNLYPVAMWLSDGNFHVQWTDDPNRGVPLERLPFVRGRLEDIAPKKK
jgi:hypothetical protein